MSLATTMNVTDAKAQFSSVVSQVESRRRRFVITKNNRPVAKIVPIAGNAEAYPGGSLAAYANKKLEAEEKSAFAKAMEAKHAADR